jgi:hypothetical protein
MTVKISNHKSTNKNEMWFMSGKKLCYSYLRWSSDKQGAGTTSIRQKSYAAQVAKDNDLTLIEKYSDDGVSAFKGKNVRDGELGVFIAEVESGAIPNDSWLVVENLDRLSRQDILKAQRLFLTLIELGITIVTGMDSKVYSNESITNNPMELMYSIMLFARAHEESKTKSLRTYGNALSVINKHLDGVRSIDNYAFALKSLGSNRWWSDCSDGTVKPHPFYFDIAKEIITMALDGYGSHSICQYLNNTYPAPLPATKVRKGIKGVWSLNRVNQFFTNRCLLGEKQIAVGKQNYVLDGYYPPLCDEQTFYKLKVARQSRNRKPLHTNKVYLFLGSEKLFCGDCGSAMTSHTSNKKVNENGKIIKYDKFRYRCNNTKANCRTWTFNAAWLDDTVLRLAANHVFRPLDQSNHFDLAIKSISEQIEDKKTQKSNLIALARLGTATESIPAEIALLEKQLLQLQQTLESAKISRECALFETVEWDDIDERVLDYHQHELRRELKQKVRLSIKKVHCQQIRRCLVKFTIQFNNDLIITAYRTPMTLVFDGKAWNELGDFYNKPVPVDQATLYKYRIEGDSTPIGKKQLKDELGDLAEFVIDAPAENVGENDTYAYKGLNCISPEMMSLLNLGHEPKQLSHDITRAVHIAEWANGFSKDVPKIIEDQYRVYKHKYKSHIAVKAKPAIHYINDIQF